ncbi:MAG TPA: S1 family peptidase [Kofleriaceae bacterium]|jgi:hypothetical protein
MRSLLCALGALGLTLAAAAPAHAAPIIGGTATQVGDYPSVVVILVGDGLCTGELIDPSWVLTAAHCVKPSTTGLANQAAVTASAAVYYETVNLNQSHTHVAHASATMFDPAFEESALGSNDMGLIKLSTPITDVAPSRVNLVASDAPVGIPVTMVGFGTTEVGAGGGAGVEYVLKNRMSVGCSTFSGFGGLSDANLMCYDQSDSKGKCEGDSGGPSFAMINGVQTIVGITSFGDENCAIMGADTRIDAEKTWLLAQIPTLECTQDSDCIGEDESCFQNACIATPFSPTGVGSDCSAGADCQSGICITGDDGMKCSLYCVMGSDGTCPDGTECQGGSDAGAQGACYPPAGSGGGGCCDASGAGAPTMGLGIALVLAGGLRRRRALRS